MINDLWYKNAVIYCLSVGTYMDANGDGIGDFQGLMRRLDYLQGLGVTAVWLMPFQNSPGRDDGYDISDYYSVDPRLRHARRFRRVHPRGQAARHPRADRSRRQPHLRTASVVSGSAARSEFANIATGMSGRRRNPPDAGQGHGVSRRAEVDLDAGSGRASSGTSTASTNFSPTSTRPIRRCRRKS